MADPMEVEAVPVAAMVVEAPVPVAAMVVEAPPVPIGVWSLRAGQALSVSLGAGAHIRVKAVPVKHAAALEAVLRRQVTVRGWVVPDLQRLTSLAAVDRLLTLGADAHTAIVASNLHDAKYLTSFRDWTWEVQDAAREVGAARVVGRKFFFTAVRKVCQTARKVVTGGLNHHRSEDWLITKLEEVRADMIALKEGIIFIGEQVRV